MFRCTAICEARVSTVTGPLKRRLDSLEAEQTEPAQAKRRERVPTLRAFVESTLIEDKVSGTLIPFKLWPAQVKALRAMAANDRCLALKARQLGMSWLALAYLLWLGNCWGDRLFVVARQSLEEAVDAIHRLKVMHSSLPEAMRPQPIVRDNVQSLEFANGSRYQALTATRRIGRGRAAYAGLADELAYWDEPAQQLVALDAACERLIVASTGNGPGDHFHKLWKQAQAGKGRWRPIFLPWSAHPNRDAEWYRLSVDESPEPRLAKREYPTLAAEAFRAPEGAYFERFSLERNVTEFDVVPEWPTWRGVDFGYRHPACLWLQRSPAGQLFVVAEFLPADATTPELGVGILAYEKGWHLAEGPRATFCDPAGNAANVQTSATDVEVLSGAGLLPRSRVSGIRDGCVRLVNLISDPDLPLVVHKRCSGLIEALSAVKPHRTRPDVYDFDSETHSHVLDALRYLVVNMALEGGTSYEPPSPSRGITSGLRGRIY